ncbi:MAG TPA: SDR family NAD(P)-dependent oxidoreductase [Rectinemataceae bacterium]|nr:SDR family NAD(P)-dependent oxidoreductase [Rectinemataceae bacterium]
MKRLALVTGAAGGLGKAFAAECAARGYDLFLTDLDAARLRSLADGLSRMHGVGVHCQACDLTEPADRAALWDRLRSLGRRLSLLVNVAGIDYEGPFAERSPEELEEIVRLNVESVVAMTRRALEFRAPASRLAIINVSSLAAFYPMPIKAVYAASKRFLLDFSRALNSEFKGSGISVTALCPAGLPSHPAVIRAIEAQGLAGSLTTTNLGFTAAGGLDRAEAGRGLYIPGLLNRLLGFLGGALPPAFVAALIGRRWRGRSVSLAER